MLKAILFDIDGVLFDSLDANITWLQDLFKQFNFPVPSWEDLKKTNGLSFRGNLLAHLPPEEKSNEDLLQKMFSHGKKSYTDFEKYIKPVQGSSEILNYVKKNYKIGFVTSRIYVSEYYFEQFKWPQVEVIIHYGMYKKSKPDPEPLLVACGRLNVDPEECVYIGDEEVDIQAAKACNMKSVLINNESTFGEDFKIKNLLELKEVFKKITEQ